MKKLLLVVILANLLVFSLGSGQNQCSTSIDCPDAVKRFTESILIVTSNFLKIYSNSTCETWAISPTESMLNFIGIANFTKGITQNEIYTALGLTSVEEVACVANIVSNEASNLPDCIEFGPATDLFANKQYQLTSEFKSYMTEAFVVENLDFSVDSSNVINSAVASQTNNRIKNIIKDGSIFNSSTGIVSVTATFITGDWEIEFQKTNDVNQFQISASQSSSQEFMYSDAIYKYGHSDTLGAKVVQINFCCQAFYVWIILPDSPFDEDNVIDKMTKGVNWYYELRDKMMKPKSLQLYVPKLNISSTLDSITLFKDATGIYSIYDVETIELEGVFEGDLQVAVTNCVQTTYHFVGYEGVSVQNETQSNETKETFKADYPHIFLIFRNERVYIAGVFRQPTSYN